MYTNDYGLLLNHENRSLELRREAGRERLAARLVRFLRARRSARTSSSHAIAADQAARPGEQPLSLRSC